MSLVLVLLGLLLAPAETVEPPRSLALNVEVESLGRGHESTVVLITIRVAPVDRPRVLKRQRLGLRLVVDEEVLDRLDTTVEFDDDGLASVYREWPPGPATLSMVLRSLDGDAAGSWAGDVEVGEKSNPFTAPSAAPPEAIALEPVSAPDDRDEAAVRILPIDRSGGLGNVPIEVAVPEETKRLVFSRDGKALATRRRAPWALSINLGEIARKTTVRVSAFDGRDRLLGEDALVFNVPTGRLEVSLLVTPTARGRDVTVAVSGPREPDVVTLHLDDLEVGRWPGCPCTTSLDQAAVGAASVLSASASAGDELRGDAVFLLRENTLVEQVEVELVQLPVIVLDQAGKPIMDLTQDQFHISEDGQAVTVDGFGTTTDQPLSLGIAVDVSGSMEDSFGRVREAVHGFADQVLTDKDEAFLLSFSFDADVRAEWTADSTDIDMALRELTAEGGTSYRDGIVRSLELFRGRRGRQALVVLTDGEDTTSKTDQGAMLRFARTMRVPVFPIGFRVGLGTRRQLRKLAADTGGESFHAGKDEELGAAYGRIETLLRSQYLLAYRPPAEGEPDRFRKITVTVDHPDAKTIRTISGYYPGR